MAESLATLEQQRDFILQQILQEAWKYSNSGRKFLAVFDLDSTLFDLTLRVAKIIDEFARNPANAAAFPAECRMLERAKIEPRLPAMPETRPTTIEGWTIREVIGNTVVLHGPDGVWRATQGDTVPGVGRIDSIVRWGSRWIVATTRGLISTLD